MTEEKVGKGMTTELEQEFFRMFGIKPKRQCYYSDTHCKNNCNKDCVNFYMKPKYPEITAEKLLEMICICNSTYINGYTNYFMATGKTKEVLKEEILKKCITLSKDIKNQIQQLFDIKEIK